MDWHRETRVRAYVYTHVYLPVLLDAQKHKHTEKTLSLIHEKTHSSPVFRHSALIHTQHDWEWCIWIFEYFSGGNLGFCKVFFFQISESRWISQIVAPPTSTFYTLIKHSFYWHCFFISRCYLDTLIVFVYSYRFGKSTEPLKIEEHLIFHHWYLHENPRIVNL